MTVATLQTARADRASRRRPLLQPLLTTVTFTFDAVQTAIDP